MQNEQNGLDHKETSDEHIELPRLHDTEEVVNTQYTAPRTASDYEAIEIRSAQQYIEKLTTFLPELLQAFSNEEVDRLMHEFASDVCTGRRNIGILRLP